MTHARWDDIEYDDSYGLAAVVMEVTHQADRHPGNDAFAAACNAATRTIAYLAADEGTDR